MRTEKTDKDVLMELIKNKEISTVEFKSKGVFNKGKRIYHKFNLDICFKGGLIE